MRSAVGQVIDIPYVWTDGVVYLHLENVGTAYTLTVNDTEVAEVEDSSTPAEFALTPYIREGKNAVVLTLRRSAAPMRSTPPRRRARHSKTATSTPRTNARSATSKSRSFPTPPANSACSNWRSSPRTHSTTTNPSP